MATNLEVDVFDRTNRLGAALEKASQSKKRAAHYDFTVKRHRKTNAPEQPEGGICVVRIGEKKAGVEQLSRLRAQLDRKQWQVLIAVLSRKLADDPRIQRILFQPGRTNALRFMIDDEAENDPAIVLEHLVDLMDNVGTKGKKAIHPPYLQASQPIRHPKSQRLDAKRIADYFDLSLRELARILGKSHPTVAKTPDSKNLQGDLQTFEAILRGRLLVNNDDALFRQWLNTGSDDFPMQDGRRPSPMDIIRMGHPEVVAGMVDRELTGEPG